MRHTLLLLLLLCLTIPSLANEEATFKGKTFLKLIDHQQYDEAFGEASQLMTSKVSARQFADGIEHAKHQLGKRSSRVFAKGEATNTLAGTKGDFYVLTWNSSFKNLPKARELVVLNREGGAWKLAGYSVIK